MSNSLGPHEPQHARSPCPSLTLGVYSNSCPSSRWCHPAISFSVVPFSSCPQFLPASGSFPMSQLLLLANYLFSFPYLTCSRTLPNMYVHHFAKMNSSVEACGRFNNTNGTALSPFLTPEKSFCIRAVREIFQTSWVPDMPSFLFIPAEFSSCH